MRLFPTFAFLAALTVALVACDTIKEQLTPDEVSFNGVTYTAIGQANFRVEEDGLVVTNIGNSGNDGARVSQAGGITEADFRVDPVDIPAGGRWGMELFDGSGASLATVWNDDVDGQRHRIEVDFAASLGVETVTVEYFLGSVIQLRVPGVVLNGGSGQRARAANVGESDEEPESVHVVRDGPKIVVATDYGGDGGGNLREDGDAQNSLLGECPSGSALVTLDFLDLPDLPTSVCTDYVQISPDAVEEDMPAVTTLEVRARTLSEFKFTDGSLD